MGSFEDAIALAALTGGPADIAAVRQYHSRGGLSINLEQQITAELGLFARAGWADGNIEPYEFTDIDRTVAAGLSLTGKQWGRPDDTVGLAGVVNGITRVHQEFLNDGGLGILVGDGMLPHPGPEQIVETYYELPVSFFKLTLDYQFDRQSRPTTAIAARSRSSARGCIRIFSFARPCRATHRQGTGEDSLVSTPTWPVPTSRTCSTGGSVQFHQPPPSLK